MRKVFFILLLSAYSLQPTAFSQSVIRPLAWEVDTARPAVKDWPLVRGETVDLECRYLSGGSSMDVRGAAVVLHCRTNGMPADLSFQVTGRVGRVSSTNLASVGWVTIRVRPDIDLPSDVARCSFALETTLASARNLVATGTLRLSGDPTGATPAALPVFQYEPRGSAQGISNALAEAVHAASTNEAALRIAADASLSASLTNEAALRIAADASHTAALTNEAALRISADASHTAVLTNEAALRSASEASLYAALATNRTTRIYGTNEWHDGNRDVWSFSTSSNLCYRIASIYPANYAPGTVFRLASDTTVTNGFITRTRSYGDLKHVLVLRTNGTLYTQGWVLNYAPGNSGIYDFTGEAEWPATVQLSNENWETDYADLEMFFESTSSTSVVGRLALQSDIPDTDGFMTEAAGDARYALSNRLASVAYSGQYYALTNRPVVLASNGIARASHAWGNGYGGWAGWTATNATLTVTNAVMTGTLGCVLQTVGEVTGIVSISHSGLGYGGYANAANVALSYDGGQSWVGLTDLPAKADRTGGAMIRITQPETAGLPGQTSGWTLYDVIVDTWIDSSRASEVFPLHAVSVQVDLPSDALDAAPKEYVDALAEKAQQTAEQALHWWEQRAQGDAYMDGHRLHLGGGWSILGDVGSFAALSNDGSVGLGVVGDSAQFSIQLANENILIARFDTTMMQILSWSGAASNMWISAATNGLPAAPDANSAWVEYSTAMDSGVWARAPVQSAALPTNAASFRISFTNPLWGQSNGYYRIMRQSGTLAALRSMVPLRAPSMMISESNSVAIATSPGVIIIDSIAAAPAAVANHAQLYSVLGELWTMDGEGNATRLSTHDGPLWIARSVNVYTGWGTTVDMVTGDRTRFRLSTLRSWAADQQTVADAQAEAIQRWQETPAKQRRTAKPARYVPQPEPEWMMQQRLATQDPQPLTQQTKK